MGYATKQATIFYAVKSRKGVYINKSGRVMIFDKSEQAENVAIVGDYVVPVQIIPMAYGKKKKALGA